MAPAVMLFISLSFVPPPLHLSNVASSELPSRTMVWIIYFWYYLDANSQCNHVPCRKENGQPSVLGTLLFNFDVASILILIGTKDLSLSVSHQSWCVWLLLVSKSRGLQGASRLFHPLEAMSLTWPCCHLLYLLLCTHLICCTVATIVPKLWSDVKMTKSLSPLSQWILCS